MPKISVIINCLNGEIFLPKALSSVFAQTFRDWELIIWDNASSDGTANVAKSDDPRVRYFRNHETIPLGAARKEAVKMALGEWIAILDCDDTWVPEKLEKQIAAVDGTEYGLCYAGVREENEAGEFIRDALPQYDSGWMLEKQLNQFEINMVTPLIRRSLLMEHNLNFDETITASEEYNLFTRLAAKAPFRTLREVLGTYRVSENSLTNKQMSEWARERFYTLQQIGEENPGIFDAYEAAFKEARARGHYYAARYLMATKQGASAREQLKIAAETSFKYKLLQLLTYSYFLWGLVHEARLKRKLCDSFLAGGRINENRH
jgi:glycosyltransferase involved in cell wall biosynthesis